MCELNTLNLNNLHYTTLYNLRLHTTTTTTVYTLHHKRIVF